jgi:hypothetical protein
METLIKVKRKLRKVNKKLIKKITNGDINKKLIKIKRKLIRS